MADVSTAATATPAPNTKMFPRASLQGLPRELRDNIYEHLAATDERIYLGKHFSKLNVSESRPRYIAQYFEPALALHPLSMTCHQMRREFQHLHANSVEAKRVFVINNFDLDQVQDLSKFLDSLATVLELGGHSYRDPKLILRLQIDNDVARSASELCEHIRAAGHVFPQIESLARLHKRVAITKYSPGSHLSMHPGEDSKGMVPGQLESVKASFMGLSKEILHLYFEKSEGLTGETAIRAQELNRLHERLFEDLFRPFTDAADPPQFNEFPPLDYYLSRRLRR